MAQIMKFIVHTEVVSSLVAHESKWAVYITNGLIYGEDDLDAWDFLFEELDRRPTLNTPEIRGNLEHGGVFFFETEEDATDFYTILCQEPVSDYICAELYNPLGHYLSENRE